jgi:hypothetical protein
MMMMIARGLFLSLSLFTAAGPPPVTPHGGSAALGRFRAAALFKFSQCSSGSGPPVSRPLARRTIQVQSVKESRRRSLRGTSTTTSTAAARGDCSSWVSGRGMRHSLSFSLSLFLFLSLSLSLSLLAEPPRW